MAETLKDAGYKRIILGGVALDVLAVQLKPYINSVVNKLHEDLKKTPGYFPPTCTHATYKDATKCATCKQLVDFLNTEYQGTQGVGRVWNNNVTDITLWDANPWHLALLFMSMKENPTTNTGPQDTDMSGLTSLMINCTRFKADKLLVGKVRAWRNKLAHHASSTSLGEQDFIDLLDDVKALLNDKDIQGHIDKNVNIEAALKSIQQKNVKAGDIFRMLHRDLQLKLVTLRAMVYRRSLFKKEEVADSKTLAEEARLHLADGGTSAADFNVLHTQLEEIDKFIQSLHLTGHLIKQYEKPEFGHVNAIPWAKTATMAIDSCFGNITIAKRETRVHIAGANVSDGRQQDRETRPKFSDIEDLLPTDPTLASRILLCGPPGSSKSTVTKQLTRLWKNNKANGRLDEYSLLFVIPVSMLTHSVTDSLVNRLMQGYCSPQQLHNIIHHHQHALLVLDGYDEGSKEQKQLVDQILSSDLFNNVTVLVTSRESFISNEQVNTIYRSHGFSWSQKHEYVNNFFGQTDCAATVRDSVLKHLVEEDSHIGKLCDIPLNTCIICHMAAEGVSLNISTRTELYDRMYKFIMLRAKDKYNKYGAEAKTEEGYRTDIDQAFQLVQGTVYWHLFDNRYILTEKSIQMCITCPQMASLLLRYLPMLGLANKESIIIRFTEQPKYTLHHKTTAEFIAAKHVCQLELGAKTEAVMELVKKGPVSGQILQFVFGLDSMERPAHLVHVMEDLGTLLLAKITIWFRFKSWVKRIGDQGKSAGVQDGNCAASEVVTRGVSDRYSGTVNNVYTRRLLMALLTDVTLTDTTVHPLLAVWAPIMESTGTEEQLTAALGYNPWQWRESVSGEDTLVQAVLRMGSLEGVEELYGRFMSAATTDLLLCVLPRLTGLTHLKVHLHTPTQSQQLWRSARLLLVLQELWLFGSGENQANAYPGNAHTTPGDVHVTTGVVAIPAPPLLQLVVLSSLPLRTTAQRAPLCGWVRHSLKLQQITIHCCRVPCTALGQQLGAALRHRQELGATFRQPGGHMEQVQIDWEAGDGEAADWKRLKKELTPYVRRRLRVKRDGSDSDSDEDA